MKRALLLAPLLALAACAQPSTGTVIVSGICSANATCAFTGKCDAYALLEPVVDPAVTDYLTLFLEVKNQLADNADATNGKTNTNDAVITSVEIQYSGALGGKDTRGVSGSVPAAGGSVVMVDAIPATAFAPLLGATVPAWPDYVEVIANIQLRGHYMDGSFFTTSVFPVTVRVSSGTGARPDSYVPQAGAVDASLACATACPHVGQYPARCY